MKLLNKLERRFGRYAIHELPVIMIAFQVVGYTLAMVAPNVLNWVCFDPASICRGQVWRLISWVLMPPSELSIFTVIMLFFYYWIARTLANTWGDFYFNIYIFGGILITDIGMMLAYPVFLSMGTMAAAVNIGLMNAFVTTYYIQTSILLAFAFTYPNAQVLLYFVIPIKMSWLGIFEAIMLAWSFYKVGMATPRLVILLSIVNFVIYFLSTRDLKRFSPKEAARRANWQKAAGQNRASSFSRQQGAGKSSQTASANKETPAGSTSRRSAAGYAKIYPNGARHRCTICGRTELDDERLEFRYCSKCEGNHEYCQDHLFTHQHIRNGVPTQDPQ